MKTSFSRALSHIGSRCSKQNALLHMVHEAAGARISRLEGVCFGGAAAAWDWRGMMVLLVKQVHLQKDGGAEADC